tara:strand:- start:2127 stop:3626 length:1500 start_codon:yes stop_codon:yes gene_type:complete
MKLDNIRLDIDKSGICNLILDTKSSEINVFNESVINDFIKATEFILNNSEIIGIIISSAKESFHDGYDLNYLYSLKFPKDIFETIYRLSKTLRRLETSGKTIVSAISGYTNLGGLELILHSHYKISDNSKNTKIIISNVKYDFCPNIGGTQRLPRLIGISETLDLLLKDEIISPKEALEKKLINKITEKTKLISECKKYIIDNKESLHPWDQKQNISPFSSKNLNYFISKIAMLHAENSDLYHSVKILISCIFEGLNTDINSGLKIEARHFTWLLNNKHNSSMIKTLKFGKPDKSFDKNEIESIKKSFEKNYAAEGVKLLIDGISPSLIENAGKRIGFLNGPLASADKIELQSIISELDSKDAPVAALIRSMQKSDRNGYSKRKGFYNYEKDKKLKIWNGLEELIPSSKKQPKVSEIEKRLLFSCINNILFNYSKLSKLKNKIFYDYISIKEIGLPAWTGGPFTWIKNYDVKNFIKENAEYAKTLGSRFIINENILKEI